MVIPIHNEEANLVYSLPSVLKLNPAETILIFDRCTDNSVGVAEAIVDRFNVGAKVKHFFIRYRCDWANRVAFVRRKGFLAASNNIVLSTDADIILDPQTRWGARMFRNRCVALVKLGCCDYPLNIHGLLASFAAKWHTRFFGPYFFRRDLWLETEDQDMVKTVEMGEEAHLWLSLLKTYKARFLPTKTLHLRPREMHDRNFLKGRYYWRVVKQNVLVTLLTAYVMLRPSLMAGYIYERLKR